MAKGLVYLLAGALAWAVVARSLGSGFVAGVGSDSQEASPTGAIKQVAQWRGGKVLLIALAVGLALYAIWRLVSAALPGGTDAEAIAKRAGYVVSAVLYGSMCATAVSLARRAGTGSGNQAAEEGAVSGTNGNESVRDLTARLLEQGWGRVAVAAAGVIAIGAALYRLKKAWEADVTDELDLAGMGTTRRRWTIILGRAGEAGRAAALALIGFFLIRAAITFSASEATGLDGALTRISDHTWGRLLVAAIAVGFLLYGLMCVATFHRRRLQSP